MPEIPCRGIARNLGKVRARLVRPCKAAIRIASLEKTGIYSAMQTVVPRGAFW
jgi:hypothetical protein